MNAIVTEDMLRQQRWAIFRMLRALGWISRIEYGGSYHAPEENWAARISFANKNNMFHVGVPGAWPGLLTGMNVRANASLPITAARLQRYLEDLIDSAAAVGCDMSMAGEGLKLYQSQFGAGGTGAADDMYSFADCARFVLACPWEPARLRKLIRLRVPEDVMAQVRDGELSPRFVIDLYTPGVEQK